MILYKKSVFTIIIIKSIVAFLKGPTTIKDLMRYKHSEIGESQ